MNRSRAFGTALVVFCMSLPASAVHALANRVFVSARSGNDANTCDNILAPCQTFAGAVTKLNPGGEAIVLDSGGYGPVTITKSLTIEAPPGVTAFIHPPSGDAVTISAGATDTVVLRGLVLNGGPGRGIFGNIFGTLHVENCVISGFTDEGIRANSAGSSVFVKDTISRKNSLGVWLSNGRVSIDHCRFEGNASDGVLADGADVTVRDSVSAGNGLDGFHAVSEGSENAILNVYECLSTNNGRSGLRSLSSGTGFVIARAANSSLSENLSVGLDNAGGGGTVTFESLGNNFAAGNLGGPTAGTISVIAAH